MASRNQGPQISSNTRPSISWQRALWMVQIGEFHYNNQIRIAITTQIKIPSISRPSNFTTTRGNQSVFLFWLSKYSVILMTIGFKILATSNMRTKSFSSREFSTSTSRKMARASRRIYPSKTSLRRSFSCSASISPLKKSNRSAVNSRST